MFEGHYKGWNESRLKVIHKYFNPEFFKNKKTLEVGCGHAFFTKKLITYGADVTASDARAEYLNLEKNIKTIQHNLDDVWNLGVYDIIIHFGVLYHLKDPKKALSEALLNSKILILESEVLDTMEDKIIFRNENGFDQGIDNVGNQISVGAIEKIITNTGKTFKRIDDPDLNFDFHHYDWNIGNNKNWVTGRRKFWIIQ